MLCLGPDPAAGPGGPLAGSGSGSEFGFKVTRREAVQVCRSAGPGSGWAGRGRRRLAPAARAQAAGPQAVRLRVARTLFGSS